MASLLPEDILFMIFKLVCEDEKEAFHEYLEGHSGMGPRWDDWGDAFELEGEEWEPASEIPPQSILLAAAVCERWQSFLTRTPSMWTELRISFHEGAAALEHARKFLRHSGTNLLQITLLWDDPSWISPDILDDSDAESDSDATGLKHASREEIMAGVQLFLVIEELYTHVHRWREFTLRTTSITHTYQALSLMSRPSVHPARKLEKLHLQFIHNPRHATHSTDEPLLFPGSMPPIRDLLLFGISWAWPSSHMFSRNLVDLRIHYDDYCTDPRGNTSTAERAEVLSQLLGALVNLQTLALELELVHFIATTPIELPHLRSLAIKSRSMASWTADFLHNVHMPRLRILTLCVATLEKVNSVEGVFSELSLLSDPDPGSPYSYLLELDELHLLNFRHSEHPWLLHRLFILMDTVGTLTLGPGTNDGNVALAMALLPTPRGLSDLPLSRLRTLVAFDVPKHVMRHIVLERTMLAGPLEELYYHYDREDKSVQDDWQHQVEKYHRIGYLSSEHYADIVGRRWSYLA